MRLATAFLALGILYEAGMVPGAARGDEPPMKRTITVTAKSEISAIPDEARVRIRIDTLKQNQSEAKVENDTLSIATMELLKSFEIDEEQISITNLSLGPRHDDRYGYGREGKLIGYGFTREIEARLSDFSKLEPLVSQCVAKNITSDISVKFRLKSQRDHQFEARALAVEYAREKAEHLSGLLGQRIGDVIRVEEDVEVNYYTGEFGGFGGFGGMGAGASLPPASMPTVQNQERAVPFGNTVQFLPVHDQTSVDHQERSEGQTEPSAYYLTDDIQYFPVGLEVQSNPAKDGGDEPPPAAPQPTPEQAQMLLAPGTIALTAQVLVEFELVPQPEHAP